MTPPLLSSTTKKWVLASFLYTLFVFIVFFSKSYSLNYLYQTSSTNLTFWEQADTVNWFIIEVIFWEIGYYALWGILLTVIVFLITQGIDIKNKVFTRKSLSLSLLLFLIVSGYLGFILRGHGFISYISFKV